MNLYNIDEYRKALYQIGIICKSNTKFMASCLFHEDKDPSMSINLEKGIYNCFSCHESGTISGLVYKVTGKGIKSIIGNDITYQTIKYNPIVNIDNIDKNLRVFGKIELLPKILYNHLIDDRQITKKCVDNFNIGYARFLKVNGTNLSNRIIIPIYYKNKLVNIEGRKVPGGNFPKVLYPKNTIKPLFNFDNLEKFDFKNPEIIPKSLILVEGLMDCLKIWSWFDKNVSCCFGNQISDIQVLLFKNNFRDITIIPDNDEAGDFLVKEIGNMNGINLKVCKLPKKYKDVGEAPLKIIENALKNIITYEEYLWEK